MSPIGGKRSWAQMSANPKHKARAAAATAGRENRQGGPRIWTDDDKDPGEGAGFAWYSADPDLLVCSNGCNIRIKLTDDGWQCFRRPSLESYEWLQLPEVEGYPHDGSRDSAKRQATMHAAMDKS